MEGSCCVLVSGYCTRHRKRGGCMSRVREGFAVNIRVPCQSSWLLFTSGSALSHL